MLYLLLFFRIKLSEKRQISSTYDSVDRESKDCRNFKEKLYTGIKYSQNFLQCTGSEIEQLLIFHSTEFSNLYTVSNKAENLIKVSKVHFRINNCLFTKCSFKKSMIYSDNKQYNLTMLSNTISNCFNLYNSISSSNIVKSNSLYADIQGNEVIFEDVNHACRAFYFERSTNTIFKENVVKNANVDDCTGSAVTFNAVGSGIPVQITDCSFTNCNANKGSTFSMSQLNFAISIIRTTFEKCKNDQKSGDFIKLNYQRSNLAATITFDQCKFSLLESNSIKSGALGLSVKGKKLALQLNFLNTIFEHLCYTGDDSRGALLFSKANFDSLCQLSIEKCTFTNVSSLHGNSIFVSQVSNEQKCSIIGCSFVDCCSSAFVVSSKISEFVFIDSTIKFSKGKSGYACGGLSIESSGQCLVDNAQFIGTGSNQALLVFHQIESNSEISVSNSIFDSCNGKDNCCFDISIKTPLFIFHNNTMKNIVVANSNGHFGSINCNNKINILTIEKMILNNNECNCFGLIFNGIQTLSFVECQFINNNAQRQNSFDHHSRSSPLFGNGGALQFGSMFDYEIEFYDCLFKNNKASKHGGAVSIQTHRSIDIKRCLFDRNSASNDETLEGKGGALYINKHSSIDQQTQLVTIEDCSFTSNCAFDGYAIYIKGEDKNNQFIIKNNKFVDNYNEDSLSKSSSVIKSEIPNLSDGKILVENTFIFNKNGLKVNSLLYNNDESQAQLLGLSNSRLHGLSNSEISGEIQPIYINNSIAADEVSNSRFIDCKIPEGEDYLFVVQKCCTFENIEFSFKNSKIGAIKVTSLGSIVIRNCEFKHCFNKNGQGSAIYINGKENVKNIKEEEEEEDYLGIIIEDDKFDSCGESGYAVHILNYPNVTIRYIEVAFSTNKGGGFWIENCGQCLMHDCNVTSSITQAVKYEITNQPASSDFLSITRCEFYECLGECCFLDVAKDLPINVFIGDCLFKDCKKDSTQSSIAIGTSTNANLITLTIQNNTFKNCGDLVGYSYVIFIHIESDGKEGLIEFKDNRVEFEDAEHACIAIRIEQPNKELNINNCSFTKCTKVLNKYETWESTASFNKLSKLTISECRFYECGIANDGGNVIAIQSEVQVSIIEYNTIEFTNPQNGGSGVSTYTDNIRIQGNEFIKCNENTIRVVCKTTGDNQFEVSDNTFTGSEKGPIIIVVSNYFTKIPIIKNNIFEKIKVNDDKEHGITLRLGRDVDQVVFENNTFNEVETKYEDFGVQIITESTERPTKFEFINCEFKQNIQSSRRIYHPQDPEQEENFELTYDNCIFEGNRAKGHGGCLYIKVKQTATIKNSQFKGNSAEDEGRGGSIYIIGPGTVSIENCTFEGDSSSKEGESIYCEGGQLTISTCKFTVKESTTSQSTIYINNHDIIIINDVEFNNEPVDGGEGDTTPTIMTKGNIEIENPGKISITGCKFQKTQQKRSILYKRTEESEIQADDLVNIELCEFTECKGESCYFDIPNNKEENININGNIFDKCKKNNDELKSNTIGLSSTSNHVALTIQNNTFKNCGDLVGYSYVIFIRIESDGKEGLIEFKDNRVEFEDAEHACIAIRIEQPNKELNINNCSFTKCTKVLNKYETWESTASFNKLSKLTISECRFYECGIANDGGNVIAIQSEVQVSIIEYNTIEFTNPQNGGSGVSTYTDNIRIQGNEFIKCNENTIRVVCKTTGDNQFEVSDNTFTGSEKGPIIIVVSNYFTKIPIIKNNIFEKIKVNDDKEHGITLRLGRDVDQVVFENNTFNEVETKYEDFGVQVITESTERPTKFEFINCEFKQNIQSSRRIYHPADPEKEENFELTYDKCIFEGNRAKGHGGCLYIKVKQTATIKNSQFKGNSAEDEGRGGSIYIIGPGTVSIENCTFEGDSSSKEGESIYCEGGELTISTCKFTVKESTTSQSTIYINNHDTIIINDVEFNNEPVDGGEGTTPTIMTKGNIEIENPGKISITGCKFQKTQQKRSILYKRTEESEIQADDLVNIELCEFTECKGESCYFDISNNKEENININGNIFDKCKKNNDELKSNTIGLSSTSNHVALTIQNNTFKNCGDLVGYSYVIFIRIESDGKEGLIEFKDNRVEFEDAEHACIAIRIEQPNKELNINNCSFTKCTKVLNKYETWESTASFNKLSKLTISECRFYECGIANDGGNVIAIQSEVQVSIIEYNTIEFTNPQNGGSGVSTYTDNIRIQGNEFIKCNENTIRVVCKTTGDNQFEVSDNTFTGSEKGPIIIIVSNYFTKIPIIKNNIFEKIKVNDDKEHGITLRLGRDVDQVVFENNTFNEVETKYEDFGVQIITESTERPTKFEFINCEFKQNIQSSRRIYHPQDPEKEENFELTYDNCIFEGNRAKGHGGCLYIKVKQTATIKNSQFKGNSAEDEGRGGSIYIIGPGSISIENCTFEGDSSSKEGESIYCEGGELTISTCKFAVKESTTSQSTIYINNHDIIIINDVEFNNEPVDGGEGDTTPTIMTKGNIEIENPGKISITGCKFQKTQQKRSILYKRTEESEIQADDLVNIELCEFTECKGESCYFDISNNKEENININGNIFDKCKKNNDELKSNTIGLSSTSNHVALTIQNNTFKNCGDLVGYSYVIFIRIESDGKEGLIEFKDNRVEFEDAEHACIAIRIEQPNKELNINNCSFTKCTKVLNKYETWESTASFNKLSKLTISECRFYECGIANDGGNVIAIQSEVQVSIIEYNTIEFTNPQNGGSGVSTYTDNIRIQGNEFIKCNENTIRVVCKTTGDNQFEVSDNTFTGSEKGPIIIIVSNYFTKIPIIKNNIFEKIKVNDDKEHGITLRLGRDVDQVVFENNTFNEVETKYEDFGVQIITESTERPTKFEFINCEFKQNIQSSRRIYHSQDPEQEENFELTYDNCIFEGNRAKGHGGCLYIKVKQTATIKNSQFKGNSAEDEGRGGSIYIIGPGTVSIENCTFEGDSSSKEGGSIYLLSSSSTTITGCSFNNCKSALSESAYTISIATNNAKIESCNISFDNADSACGGIDFGTLGFSIENCYILRTNSKGSILFAQSEESQDQTFSMTNCIFEDCKGDTSRCFSISLIKNLGLTFENNTIQKMQATGSNGYFGSITFNKIANFDMKNIKFIENQCNSLYGGGSGLLISGTEKITFTGCEFTSNSALQIAEPRPKPENSTDYYNGDGGGIQFGYSTDYYNVDIEFNQCSFKGNKAFRHGGAVALQTVKTVTITYCTFEGNSANNQETSSKLLYDTYYHLKNEGRGGAIYINPTFSLEGQSETDKELHMTKVDINNCEFKSNSAFDGFAIYIEGDDAQTEFSFTKNKFIDNVKNGKTDEDIHAIYRAVITSEILELPEDKILDENENEFSNTNGESINKLLYVDHEGNPIIQSSSEPLPTDICEPNKRCDIESDGTQQEFNITKSEFINLTWEDSGAAIYFINCGINLDKTYFYNCSSTNGGGGGIYIYLNTTIVGTTSIKGCTFTKCKSYYGGAIYAYSNLAENKVLIDRCQFNYNDIIPSDSTQDPNLYGGSAIYMTVKKGNVHKCKFTKNSGKGAVKVYNNFDIVSRKVKEDEEESSVQISQCQFEIDSSDPSSCSLYYIRGANEAVNVDVVNCEFIGDLAKESRHIDGFSQSDVDEAPKLRIKGCKFSSDKNSFVNRLELKEVKHPFISFDDENKHEHLQKEKNHQSLKIELKNNNNNSKNSLRIISSITCVAIIAALVIITKNKRDDHTDNDNENNLIDEIITNNFDSLV